MMDDFRRKNAFLATLLPRILVHLKKPCMHHLSKLVVHAPVNGVKNIRKNEQKMPNFVYRCMHRYMEQYIFSFPLQYNGIIILKLTIFSVFSFSAACTGK